MHAVVLHIVQFVCIVIFISLVYYVHVYVAGCFDCDVHYDYNPTQLIELWHH